MSKQGPSEPISVFVDDTLHFGHYAPRFLPAQIIKLTRLLGTQWLAKRLIFTLRRIAKIGMGSCADTVLFDARLRLYTSGNVSEKRALFAPKLFDAIERKALNSLARPNGVFLDIGSNIGLYSFSVAQAFKNFPGTQIIAVEPHPQIAQRLKYNCDLNPELNIHVAQIGVSNTNGHMSLAADHDNLGQTRLLENGEVALTNTIEVPVLTLMTLVENFKLSHIDGMKIDVEGQEEAVLLPFLENAPDALLPRLIVIEDNRRYWKNDLVTAAAKRGYQLTQETRMNLLLSRAPVA